MNNGKINVLALVTDAWGGFGGIAQYNRDLLGGLCHEDERIEIKVISRTRAKREEAAPPGISMIYTGGKIGFLWCILKHFFGRRKFQLVFCGHINFVFVSAILARKLKIPMWLQVHGIDAWTCPGRLRQWGTERAALVTAVSRYTRKRLLAWVGLNTATVKVLPNTVSEEFSPGSKPAHLLEKYGLEGKRVLLTVARLSAQEQYKGHDLVIAAMPELVEEYQNLQYLIVGDGQDRGRLKSLAQARGMADRVTFAGNVDARELPDHYRLADVFVMPSTGEGFGIAFLEAAATGIPVIGSNQDGSVDALRDGAVGNVISPGHHELVASIRGVLNSPLEVGITAEVFKRTSFSNRAVSLLQSQVRVQ